MFLHRHLCKSSFRIRDVNALKNTCSVCECDELKKNYLALLLKFTGLVIRYASEMATDLTPAQISLEKSHSIVARDWTLVKSRR